jgi:hypothetical protein
MLASSSLADEYRQSQPIVDEWKMKVGQKIWQWL